MQLSRVLQLTLLSIVCGLSTSAHGQESSKKLLNDSRSEKSEDAENWLSLSAGMEGEAVKALQRLLIAKGQTVSVNGEFDTATKAAVENVQRAAGVAADGIVGPVTWRKLFSTVQRGDRGEVVRGLQHMLRHHGYGIAADGVFGGGVESAVEEFQFISDLDDDGIVGDKTWKALLTWNRVFPSHIIGDDEALRCDPAGLGHYLASRGGRPHHGVDILAEPMDPVHAPFAGVMLRVAAPNGNGVLSGIYIEGTDGGDWEDFKVKMFYLTPTIAAQDTFASGGRIGTMQRILDGPSYSNTAMLNHVHVEVEYKGRRVNPISFINLPQPRICD